MEKFDHVIIGGGIIGCSIAFHLARAGGGRILVIERNELASAASSLAAGLVLEVTSKPVNGPLVRATLAMFDQLEDDLGESVGFHRVGSLRVAASPAGRADLGLLFEEAERQDASCERVDVATAKSMVPWLELPDDAGAVFMAKDGYVDPYLLAMACMRAAKVRGVEFRPRCAVSDIVVEGGRVVGVEVAGEKISAGMVIDAGGAWAGLLSGQTGFDLPMVPVRSHYWICEPEDGFGDDHPVTMMNDFGAYTRSETGGLVFGVQEKQSKTFDARELPDDILTFSPTTGEEHFEILAEGAEAVEPLFPDVMTARFSRYVAGLSTYTPDGLMLLGPVPGVSGFLVAAGCCGNGVALSGGIGQAVCDLALGREPDFDISAFDPGRFGRVEPYGQEFRNRCAAARASKSRSAD